MICTDIIEDFERWAGLRLEIPKGINSAYQLESGLNTRFKLSRNNTPIFWGTFGIDYWGVWVLQNKLEWELDEMPVVPINSHLVEESKTKDYHRFWARYFAHQLNNASYSVLSEGLWTLTIGPSYHIRGESNARNVSGIEKAFAADNPRWLEWGASKSGSIIALKEEPSPDHGRVKWYRKLVKAEVCPPVLVWYFGCLAGYVILDGHCRLKAFQLESVPPRFQFLNSGIEQENKTDPKVQESVLLSMEKRQSHRAKSKMQVDQINRLLISVFDTRPFFRSVTKAKAQKEYEEKWTSEVRTMGRALDANPEWIEDMIQRIEY